ncbi:hypothetical protein QR721_09370 [Aciduricibacillus chroicocephali]|uniref:Uncharacterized protein n=1 Tax=Aciduricibacillus chroicocephali TaxID=3054939 RepID=A0ABY9KT00_9BACI|nr:hypothetical protein QR721_09370 [Bacillaceae bacterium 44XB]
MGKKSIAAAFVIVGLTFSAPYVSFGQSAYDNATVSQVQQNDKLDKARVSELMERFSKELNQPTDQEGRVLNIKDKSHLLEKFATFAEPSAVKPFINELYRQAGSKLFLKPVEGPPDFDEQLDYDMVQLTEDRAEVKQKLNSALYGNLTMRIHFHHSEGTWKIARIQYEQAVD